MVVLFVPEAVQTVLGPALNVTGLPEARAAALTVNGADPNRRRLLSAAKLIVCAAFAMVSVPPTGDAV